MTLRENDVLLNEKGSYPNFGISDGDSLHIRSQNVGESLEFVHASASVRHLMNEEYCLAGNELMISKPPHRSVSANCIFLEPFVGQP